MHWIRAEGINSVTIKAFDDNRLGMALLPGCSDLKIAKGFRELYRIMNNEAMWGKSFCREIRPSWRYKPFSEAWPSNGIDAAQEEDVFEVRKGRVRAAFQP